VGVDPSQFFQGGISLGLTLEVHYLTTGQTDVADGLAQSADDVEDAVGGNVLGIPGNVLKGGGEEGIAGKNGNVLAIYDLWFRICLRDEIWSEGWLDISCRNVKRPKQYLKLKLWKRLSDFTININANAKMMHI